jgi:hypothetical protein
VLSCEEVKKRTLTLEEAARLSHIPLEELRTAVKDGLLVAVRLANTGVIHVDEEELRRYLRASRKLDLADFRPIRRILILDDDVRFAEALRLHLERDTRLEARIASWGRDAVTLLNESKPNLVLLGIGAASERADLVLEVLGLRGFRKSTRVLAYGGNTTRAEWDEDWSERLRALGVGAPLSKARGTGDLARACVEALGLEPSAPPSR